MVIIVTNDTHDIFSTASRTIQAYTLDAVDDTVDVARMSAKSFAPVYKPFRYPQWRRFSHAKSGGKLKNSIRKKKTHPSSGRTIKSGLISRVRYSGFQEAGFYHKRAKRWIPGKFYMRGGALLAFKYSTVWNYHIQKAFTKAFSTHNPM